MRPTRFPLAFVLVALVSAAPVLAEDPGPDRRVVLRNPELLPPMRPVSLDVDLRDLPLAPDWQPGDPIKEVPRRFYPPKGWQTPPEPQTGPDPLLEVQEQSETRNLEFTTPILNFDAQNFTGVNPPDTIGDVGPNHYIHIVNNSSSSRVLIYNKSGSVIAGPFLLSGLGAPAPCNSGFGDPVVLWDSLADRWLMSEFAGSGNNVCIYISKTSDPVSGGWWFYRLQTTTFPDYPKFAVWPDAYYMTSNEGSPNPAYALDRTNMLNGAPARATQRFLTATGLNGFGFQSLTPADLDGPTPPPAGAPGIFARHRDDEVHNPPGNPAIDFIDMWEFHVDFNTPGNSTFSQLPSIQVTDFSSELCGLTAFACFPQPGSGVTLDPLREVIMWRLQYRNWGAYQGLVGNFVTDADGEGGGDPLERGGVRWFELRKPATTWSLQQEGTFSPDVNPRWMGAIAMDGSGDMAVGYSISSPTVFPSLRFTGRAAADAPGTMRTETSLVAGVAANASNRWGDYSAMSVDPVDDCTFWFTGMYSPATVWRTRVGTFRFATCGTPTTEDLSITKTDGVTTVVAGQPVTYTIVASNAGPDVATGASVSDTLPLLNVTWTCTPSAGSSCAASGSGDINQSVTIAVGGSVTFTATGTVPPGTTGSITNTATVGVPPAGTDPNPGNNSASDTDTVTQQADVSITKTDGSPTAVPGQPVTYTIAAGNNGPSSAVGATVADTFPAAISGVNWTCAATSGSSCGAASGTGNISQTVTVAAAGTVTFTATGTVSAGATGTLSNTATVAPPAGVPDPVPGNNSATDTDTLSPVADLSMTKTDGLTMVRPGQVVTYTIVASNTSGPSSVTGAVVTDTLPAVLTGGTWTCVGAGGGTCTASGTGNIADTVNLPVTGTVTYTLTATVSLAASGTVSNTATVAPPTGSTDPTPGNNSATDTDSVAPMYFTVTPCRVLDTRVTGPALAANTLRTFPVGGLCGIPADAKAVAFNVTVVGETDTGDLRVFPAGGFVPLASTINFAVAHVRANNALIPLGTSGQVSVVCDMPTGSTGQTHLVLDVYGYFR